MTTEKEAQKPLRRCEQAETRTTPVFMAISEILSILIFFAGCAVLLGWALDIPVLKSVLPGFVAMKANTALCFVFIGFSLWSLQIKRLDRPAFRRLGLILGLAVFGIGSLTFFEYLSGLELGIDQFLFIEPAGAILTSSPGRMAFNTAINFTVAGLALGVLASKKGPLKCLIAQILIIPEGGLSLLALTGYLYQAPPLFFGTYFSTAMALHTVLLFMFLFFGILFCRPGCGLMTLVSSDTVGGKMVRRLFPAAVAFPVILGFLDSFGHSMGVSDFALRDVFVAIITAGFTGLYFYFLAFRLDTADAGRVRADKMLRESEGKFRLLADLAPAGIYLTTPEGECTYVNQRWCEMAGLTFEEALGKGWTKGIYHEDRQMLMDSWNKMVASQGQWGKEYRFQDRGGKITWVFGLATPQRNDDGKIAGYVGLNMDITERKKAEEEIKTQKYFLEQAQELGKIGSWTLDAVISELIWTDENYRIFGLPIGMPLSYEAFLNCVHPDDREYVDKRWIAAMRGEETYDIDHRLMMNDGRVKWVREKANLEFDQDGKFLRGTGFTQDITESKQTEEVVQKARKRFQEIFEEAPMGIAMIDSFTRRIYEVNSKFAKIAGRTREEMATIDCMSITHPDDVQEDLDKMALLNAGKISGFTMQKRYRRPDGSYVWINMTIAPMTVEDKNQPRHLCMIEDITEDKRIEKELCEQENRLKGVAAQVPGMLYQFMMRVDGTYCVPYSSVGIKEIFGCSPEDVRDTFDPVLKVILPEDREKLVHTIDQSAKDLTPWQCEYRVQSPGQSVRWMLGSSTPDKMQDGSIIWSGYNVDVTERKQVEEELKLSKQKMDLALHSARMGVWQLDLVGNKRILDLQTCYLIGIDPDKFGGTEEEFFSSVHPEDRDKIRTALMRTIHEGVLYEPECRAVWPDGSIHHIAGCGELTRDDQGKPRLINGVIWDITEHKKAEEALRESEEKYRSLFESMQEGFALHEIICDTRGVPVDYRFLDINPAFEKLTGLRRADLIGKGVLEVLPQTEAFWIERYGKVALTGESVEFESHTVSLNKHYSIVAFCPSPGRFAVIFEDVTQRRLAEEGIRKMNLELEERVKERTEKLAILNKEMEAFSYSVAHDLKAPLRAMAGFANILLEDYASKIDKNGRRVIGVINDNARTMGKLIDDLLELSLLGRKVMEVVDMDMNTLVRSVVGELKNGLDRERSIEVSVKSLSPARVDATLIKQIFVNLISNAIKFSVGKKETVIEIGEYEKEGERVYYVKDNGAGFDMKYQGKLFGIFQRLHSQEQFPGTGIGLAIVSSAVQRHGGRVWAEAAVDQGATFYFTLPKGG